MNLPEDLDRLKKLAETSPKAQFALAWFYLPDEQMNFVDERYKEYQLAMFEGVSVENEMIVFPRPFDHSQHDLGQAFDWLKKSAESGFDEAYYPLASLYVDQENIVDAEIFAKQAENSGFKESNLILGKINALKEQYKLAYEYYVKALNAGIQRAYGPLMKIVLKGYIDTDQAKADIEKFKPFMLNRLEENVRRCNHNRFFGQEITFAGPQEIDVPIYEDDDREFENSFERIETDYKWMADQLAEVGQISINRMRELEKYSQELRAKDRELEETMAMFAHKFRGPLDVISSNIEHGNQEKLYRQSAQTMRGLLDIFSMIATDSETLVPKIQQDSCGSGRLVIVLERTLDMILLHLLSTPAAAKIQQHYLRYAKSHDLCDAELSDRVWKEEYFELERQLQVEWEHSYAQLLADSATLKQRLGWLEERFFKLEVRGFERSDIQFREYGDKESLLTIVLNEVLVNAFKYYASPTRQPVVLEWLEREHYQILRCQNPSQRNERNKLKGSRKGHVFLSSLARKTASEFSKPKAQDEFVVEFGFARELLISS